jgi:hypothetical protein
MDFLLPHATWDARPPGLSLGHRASIFDATSTPSHTTRRADRQTGDEAFVVSGAAAVSVAERSQQRALLHADAQTTITSHSMTMTAKLTRSPTAHRS